MKIGKRKISTTVLALILICIVLSTALAIIYYQKNIQTSVSLVSHGFKLYSDVDCTMEITSWTLTDCEVMQEYEQVIYAKRHGSNNLNVTWSVTLPVPDLGGFLVEQANSWTWNNGEGYMVTFYVDWMGAVDYEPWLPKGFNYLDDTTPLGQIRLRMFLWNQLPEEGLSFSFDWLFDAKTLT